MSGADSYDIRTHAVFEASAGTGKTYTVEQLVLRFLRNGVPLDQILIVTYTEKAAAELQDRLRAAISSKAQSETGASAQERYDEAQIFTIHAFCLGILQQFPFDHRQNPRAQMTRDQEVMEACLREVQRGDWPAAWNKDLTSLLAVADFNLDRGGAAWDGEVCQIAARFRPDCGHRLEPDQQLSAKELQELRQFFATELEHISRLAGKSTSQLVRDHPLYIGYNELPFRADHRASRCEQLLVPILMWITDPASQADPIASFARMYNESVVANKKDSFEILSKDAKTPNAACRHLQEIVDRLNAMRARLAQIEHVLATTTVRDLLKRMERYKQERGLHSFEDFLTRVARALQPEHNPRAGDLVQSLRSKYRIAIVDEFQDTDPLQWGIFKRLFVEGTKKHQLILVGDPKQAIYSFRNADVNTYLQARTELKELGTPVLPLKVNFRSCAALVHGLNTLFRDGGFFSGGGIVYEDVKPAPDEQRPEAKVDRSGRKAITVVNFPDGTNGTAARRQMAQFIGAEIARLLQPQNGKPVIEFGKRGPAEPLRADQIAVLLFRRNESRWIEEQLRHRGIPYTFYKKTGIWQSDEAIHLNIVLKALARTGQPELFREMLLTRFFGIQPEQVAAFEHSSQTDALHRLFLRWRELCDRRRWAELFRSVLEDTDTLCIEHRQFDGSRRIANYRYIAQELSRAAYERGLSLLDIVELLQQKRLTSGEDESGLQPLETERPAVKIMTIHSSKGLEFPIVFLGGGLTQSKARPFCKYHDDDGRLVINLRSKDTAAQGRAEQEENEEKHRLLYVALTRAMLKLYVPALGGKTRGPVPDLLTPAIARAKLDQCEHAQFIAPPQTIEAASSAQPVTLNTAAIQQSTIRVNEPLLPAVDFGALASRRIDVQSFSRLVQHARPVEIPVLEKPARADDDAQPEELVADDLPPGAAAGEVLHNVLEEIDFVAVRSAVKSAELLAANATRSVFESSLRANMPEALNDGAVFDRRCKRIAELVWNTLRTPLPQLAGRELCTLEPRERIHELEFHMPFRLHAKQTVPAEISSADGFMTGFMDLVFVHDERFYLLDWKSNALSNYTAGALERDMHARHYHLQYRIYLQALLRWLKATRKSANPAALIGGVFYIYSRGMQVSAPTRGIFYRQPSAEDFDERKLAEDLVREAQGGGLRHE